MIVFAAFFQRNSIVELHASLLLLPVALCLADCAHAAEAHLAFTEDTGVIRNPGQGWSTDNWTFRKADPHVNVGALYARVNWSALEPEEGVYDEDYLDEVAERVGYRSASSFSTAFRRVTGMSPGRFRAG